jgi:peptidyl-prolyl cis-trans isomerase SurA
MMQMTGAAFQAQANLKEQVTDPMSHTPATDRLPNQGVPCHLLIPMVDTICDTIWTPQVSDQEVDRAIEDVLKQNNIGPEQLEEALAAQGLNMAEYRLNLGRQLLNFKLVGREIRSETEVTNQELRNYFQEHVEDYREAPFIRLSRISFFFPKGIGSSGISVLRARSGEALQRLRGGESFDDVLAVYSGDKGAEGGPMGTFGDGELAEPFSGAAAGLSVGQVSEVVETPQGFHILRLDEKNPGRIPAFEEVRDRLSNMILERKRKEAISGWTEKLKKEAHIEIRL